MWAEETEDQRVSLVLYCEKLTPLLKENTDRVWWALSMLVDQTIGEISSIALIAGFDIYAQPKDEPAMLLDRKSTPVTVLWPSRMPSSACFAVGQTATSS